MILKFLNPAVDFVFKRVFGSEDVKEVFMSFVNSAPESEGDRETVETFLDVGEPIPESRPACFIGVSDFSCPESEACLSNHLILDRVTGNNESKDFEFCFIELPKFDKTLSADLRVIDKRIYFLRRARVGSGSGGIVGAVFRASF